MKKYKENRINFYRFGTDTEKFSKIIREAEELHHSLWKLCERISKTDRGPHSSLYIASINSLIDIHELRIQNKFNHVPEPVYWIILLVSIAGMVSWGYNLNNSSAKSLYASLAFLISFVICIVMGLDRTNRGLVRVYQESILKLKSIDN